ncbi:MAG: hypothetical protein ABIQ95_13080, partial [Bdellovibrionia bacterium]
MQGLSKIQASGIKDPHSKSGVFPKKLKAPKEEEFESQLNQTNVPGVFPNNPPAIQSQNNINLEVDYSQLGTPKGQKGAISDLEESEIGKSKEYNIGDFGKTQSRIPTRPSAAKLGQIDPGSFLKTNSANQEKSGVLNFNPEDSELGKLSLEDLKESGAAKIDWAKLASAKLRNADSQNLNDPKAPKLEEKVTNNPDLKNPGLSNMGGTAALDVPALQQDPAVTVTYTPIEKSDLTTNPQLGVSDRLWFPVQGSVNTFDSVDGPEINPA